MHLFITLKLLLSVVETVVLFGYVSARNAKYIAYECSLIWRKGSPVTVAFAVQLRFLNLCVLAVRG